MLFGACIEGIIACDASVNRRTRDFIQRALEEIPGCRAALPGKWPRGSTESGSFRIHGDQELPGPKEFTSLPGLYW